MSILYIRDKNGKFVPIPAIQGANGKSAYESAKDGGYTGTEDEFNSLLNGLTGFENAEHYVNYNNPHKVTAEQIGSLKMYSGFASVNADLGKKFNSGTPIGDIIKALPDNTGLVADITPAETQLYPSQYGTLAIYKIREQRVTVTYREWNSHRLWLGDYTQTEGFKGFKRMLVEPLEDGISFDGENTDKPIVMKNSNRYCAFEKYRRVDNRPCRMDVGLGTEPSAALQLAIGEENATEAPEQYTHRMILSDDGIEFSRKNEDDSEARYKIFGEHNKPGGYYDGNEEIREIDIGGEGKVVFIYGPDEEAGIVTPIGAFLGNIDDVGYAHFARHSTYKNGKLSLGSTRFNKTGHTYYWQVL
jgi:hypothetical protein